MQKALRILLPAGACAVLMAGCGEDRESGVKVEGGTDTAGKTSTGGGSTATTPTTSEKPRVTGALALSEYRLRPKEFEMPKAGSFRFKVVNQGKTVHALEVEGPKGEVETKELKPGAKANLDVDASKDGDYKLYCPVSDHEKRGMTGKLTVGKVGRTESTESSSGSSGGY